MGRLDCLVLEKSGTFTENNKSIVTNWWMAGTPQIQLNDDNMVECFKNVN